MQKVATFAWSRCTLMRHGYLRWLREGPIEGMIFLGVRLSNLILR